MSAGVIPQTDVALFWGPVLIPAVIRYSFGIWSRKASYYQFSFDTSEPPGLGREFDDLAHADEQGIEMSWVGEMFDKIDDFIDNHCRNEKKVVRHGND